MTTRWKIKPLEEGFRLRVRCSPVGETAREDEWIGLVRIDRNGRVMVEGMVNSPEELSGDSRYLKHDIPAAGPGEIPGMMAGIAARCASATLEMELWERTAPEREEQRARDAVEIRKTLGEMAAEGEPRIL